MDCKAEEPGGDISSALQGAAVGLVIASVLRSEPTWKPRPALFARQTTLCPGGAGGWRGGCHPELCQASLKP